MGKFKMRLKSGQEQPGERTVIVSSSGLDWGSSTIWLPIDAQIPVDVTLLLSIYINSTV
jgi:hypothetical protein